MATPASETSSAVIDERRAQQLMERALTLAERGDQQGAVLSCRQAVALAPESAQAYSMLGLLLERSGEANGAIAAYEKVLQLAPDSLLERESLSRLRATVAHRRTVHEPLRNAPVTDGAVATPAAVSTPALNTPAVSTPAGTREENVAVRPVATPAPVPVMPLSATMPMPGIDSGGRSAAPASSPATSWQKLRQRPSLYFRGAPLAATTALSLVFLLWAQSYSASRRASQLPPGGAVVEVPAQSPIFAPDAPGAEANRTNPGAGNRATGANSPVPTNPTTAAPAGSATTSANVQASAPPRSAAASPSPNAPSNAPSPDAAGSTPGAGATPANARAAGADEDGGRLTTPPAPVAAPSQPSGARTGATSAAPAAVGDSGSASTRGGPLGPGSTPGRSYVRVTPAGSSPVARPENRAANDERAAGSDAQAGRSSAAIERITQAIDSGGPDVALRFQQRAQLYYRSGDAQRAISDFQAAISAYNDMLARGDRVSIARSGIAACRRGIQMAQASLAQAGAQQ